MALVLRRLKTVCVSGSSPKPRATHHQQVTMVPPSTSACCPGAPPLPFLSKLRWLTISFSSLESESSMLRACRTTALPPAKSSSMCMFMLCPASLKTVSPVALYRYSSKGSTALCLSGFRTALVRECRGLLPRNHAPTCAIRLSRTYQACKEWAHDTARGSSRVEREDNGCFELIPHFLVNAISPFDLDGVQNTV